MAKHARSIEHRSRRRLLRNLDLAARDDLSQQSRRQHARHAACYAENLGIITRPGRCEWCRHPGRRLTRHHTDYAKPLHVLFLCWECHALADTMDLRETG